MTEQDAESDDASADSEETVDGTGAASEGSDTPEDESAAELSDIASEPEGGVDEALAAILGEAEEEGDDGEESEEETGTGLTDIEPVETVDDALVDELAETPPETTARIVATLRRERERLAGRLGDAQERAEDFESRLKRKQADFQNYKKRQQKRLEEEKQRATEDLVERLLDVRDNLERALDQDEDVDIRDGVESTLDQFDEQLARENVERIRPEPGGETDPQRHEVLATVDSDQPEDTIAEVYATGYEMGGKVLRPAQVVVSNGSNSEE